MQHVELPARHLYKEYGEVRSLAVADQILIAGGHGSVTIKKSSILECWSRSSVTLTYEEEVVDQPNHTGGRWPYTVRIVHFLLVGKGGGDRMSALMRVF